MKMSKEMIPLGIAGIVVGIAIYLKTSTILPSLVPTLVGIALIKFYKAENKIEKREDK